MHVRARLLTDGQYLQSLRSKSKARRPLQDLPKPVGRHTKTSFPVTQTSLLHGAVEAWVTANQLLQQPCRSLALIKRDVYYMTDDAIRTLVIAYQHLFQHWPVQYYSSLPRSPRACVYACAYIFGRAVSDLLWDSQLLNLHNQQWRGLCTFSSSWVIFGTNSERVAYLYQVSFVLYTLKAEVATQGEKQLLHAI